MYINLCISPGAPAHLEHPQHSTRQAQPTASYPLEDNLAYKPFEMVPSHIKRLIYGAYGPQQPYVNPHAFFYKNYVGLPDDFLTADDSNHRRADESIVSSTASPISYSTAFPQRSETIAKVHSKVLQRGGIKYREDKHQVHQDQEDQPRLFSPQQNYGYQDSIRSHRNSDQTKRSSDTESSEELQGSKYDMPEALQTLLQYQAQIPYNVLANHIAFESKKPFVPKPLPDDVMSAAQYPSKIFYIRADGQILEQVPAMGISGGEIKYKDP